MWGPVISGVLLRLYWMGLRPNDPVRGCWQVRGWSVKVITGVALTEELKVIMVIPNLSEVKSHLGTFVRGAFKPSYPYEYSFNVISWQGIEHWIKGREEETNIYKNCYLNIKCFLTNSLTTLMWRWYLNSEQAALQLVVENSWRCEIG